MEDLGPESPRPVGLSSFMAAAREAARAEAGRQRRDREVAIPLDLSGHEGGYTPDPNVMATIKWLPSHLQLVVTLMANMVAPAKEDKLREKRGFNALSQATSMILVVSLILLIKFF